MKNKFNNKENLVLIDANAWIFHSFYGTEEKLDKSGKDQRVLFGILNRILNLTYILPKIDNLFIIFDAENNHVYRKSLYPEYKMNRPETEAELVRQKNDAIQIFKKYIGLPCLIYDNYEADDVIGTLTEKHKDQYQVIIVSPDKDLMQLVTDDVLMLKKNKKSSNGYDLLDYEDIVKKIGIDTKQIPDFLALMGDSIDNLPGIDGVGEKTAIKILNKYKSIEHILAVQSEIENKVLRENIAKHKNILLIKHLAKVVIDLPIEELINYEINRINELKNTDSYINILKKLKIFFNWKDNFITMLE